MNIFKFASVAALFVTAGALAQEQSVPRDQLPPEGQLQRSEAMPEFRSLDVNGDGMLSEQEAQADPNVWRVFTQLDADRSGSLSSSEYAAGSGSESSPKDPSSTGEMNESTTPLETPPIGE